MADAPNEALKAVYRRGLEVRAARQSWDEHFMAHARLAASRSKDPSTQVGAVIVGPDREIRATGFNGFPRLCSDAPATYADRPRKHLRIVHAEANAVAAAARVGVSLKGCTAYVTAPCCAQCAALLIQAGVKAVVWSADVELRSDWMPSLNEAQEMFREAGVEVRQVAT